MTDNFERMERRIGHVERQLATHGEQLVRNSQAITAMKDTSAERLEYIKERFDEMRVWDEKILMRLEKRSQFGRWATNLAVGILFVVAGAINRMYLEPMSESIGALERRILAVETKAPQELLEPK